MKVLIKLLGKRSGTQLAVTGNISFFVLGIQAAKLVEADVAYFSATCCKWRSLFMEWCL